MLPVMPTIGDSVRCGELAGTATPVQCPNISASYVMFHNPNRNSGDIIIGGEGVTDADGTADFTTGFKLSEGEKTDWIPVCNLDRFYYYCEDADETLCFIAVG